LFFFAHKNADLIVNSYLRPPIEPYPFIIMILLELISATVQALFIVLVICSFGIACSLFPKSRPILNPEARRDLGSLLLQVASPAIAVASIGSKVHLDELVELWDLFFWCILSCALGLLTSVLFTRVLIPSLRCDPLFEGAFTMAATFGNTGTLPIIILDVLCETQVLTKRMGNAADCAADARAYVMIYNVSWCILIFGLYIPIFKRLKQFSLSEMSQAKQKYNVEGIQANLAGVNIPMHNPSVPSCCTNSLNDNGEVTAVQNCIHSARNSFNVEVHTAESAHTNQEASTGDNIEIVTNDDVPTTHIAAHHYSEEDSQNAINSITKLLPDGVHAPLPIDFFDAPEVNCECEQHNNLHGQADHSSLRKPDEFLEISGYNPSLEDNSTWHHLANFEVSTLNRNQQADEVEGMAEMVPQKSLLKSFFTALLKPPIFASFIGLAVGLIEPLSSALFPSSTTELSFGFGLLAGLGRAVLLVGNMGVTLGAMVMAASLTFEPPNERAKVMDDPLMETRDTMTSPVASEVSSSGQSQNSGSNAVTTTAALCLIRLALVPAFGFALMWAIISNESSPFQGDRGGLRALIILIMFSVPSGQTVISVMAIMQLHLLGKNLAKAYIVMYIASALTMSLWTALALSLVESHVWSSLDK